MDSSYWKTVECGQKKKQSFISIIIYVEFLLRLNFVRNMIVFFVPLQYKNIQFFFLALFKFALNCAKWIQVIELLHKTLLISFIRNRLTIYIYQYEKQNFQTFEFIIKCTTKKYIRAKTTKKRRKTSEQINGN